MPQNDNENKKKKKVKVTKIEGKGLFGSRKQNTSEEAAPIDHTQIFDDKSLKKAEDIANKGKQPKLSKEQKAQLKEKQLAEYNKLKRIKIKNIPKAKRKKFRAQKRKLRKAVRPTYIKVLLGLLWAGIAACFIVGCAGLYFLVKWMGEAPPLDLSKFDFVSSTIVYDYEDKEYQALQGTENRIPVSIDQVPEMVQLAFVAIEDQRYYSHSGVDLRGTAKAVISVLTSGSTSGPGGSTITQQLIKLTHLTSETKISRKVMEWKLAFQLERQLNKREILEAYLNKVNMSITWGIQAAADAYFDVDVSQLSIAQAAVLAAIINNPSEYNPYVYEKDAEGNYLIKRTADEAGNMVYDYDPSNCERATLVVQKMFELGYISEKECNLALDQLKNNKIGLVYPKVNVEYSYFTDAVYQEVLSDLMETYNYNENEASDLLLNGGLKVYSTVDATIQGSLEDCAASDGLFPDQSYSAAVASAAVTEATGEPTTYLPQVGGAVIENTTGYVVGIIGGRSKEGSLTMNRALQKFQTGSVTKPITVYSPGLDTGILTLAKTYDNVNLNFGGWRVANYPRVYTGMTSVRQGLTESINIVAVLAQMDVGIETSAAYGKLFGFELVEGDYNTAALALGGYTYGQTPLAVASAFTVFPNMGYRITPTFYRKVTDSDGTVILESKQETVQVISEQTAWLITDVLKNVVRGGTTYRSISGQEIGGKTGTTDDNAAVWFAGYTAHYTGAFWYGYDVASVSVNGTSYSVYDSFSSGGNQTGPARFWELAFETFYGRKSLPSASLPGMPSGITGGAVDKVSGKIPTELTELDPRGSMVGSEYFNELYMPSEKDDMHQYVMICSETGLLATEYCPSTQKVMVVKNYAVLHKGATMIDPTFVYEGEIGAIAPQTTCTVHNKDNMFYVNRIFAAESATSTTPVNNVNLKIEETESFVMKRVLSTGVIEKITFESVSFDVKDKDIATIVRNPDGTLTVTAHSEGNTSITVSIDYNYGTPTHYTCSTTLNVHVSKKDVPIVPPDPGEPTDPDNPTDPSEPSETDPESQPTP